MKIYETLANGIKIVEYDDALAQSIADMNNASRDEWGGDTGIEVASNVIRNHAIGSLYNAFCALDGDEVVGYCSLARYFRDADTLYIPNLNVRPDYHGKKIGKALVLRALARTIELDYPRLDLFTWSGNTAAVPLYKKCGFLWEDRSDSNHFVNFIPTVLKTGLFSEFFKKADWYNDSTRVIDITADGIKKNGFEIFGYSWEHDGKSLAVGFERSGRMMRYIETDDFKIEFMAEEHELAFGLQYDCALTVENKSGRPLHIKASGRDEQNIKFSFNANSDVAVAEEFKAKFFVEEIEELIDKWRVHPCLIVDVEVNGYPLSFGLGIHAKFPLLIDVKDEIKVKKEGLDVKSFINIRSSLPQDATVRFSFPENNIVDFNNPEFQVNVAAKGRTSIPATAKILNLGYAPMPTKYDITLTDGTMLSFEKPLHYSALNLTEPFSAETDDDYRIVNGPWQLLLLKRNNETILEHLTNSAFTNDDFLYPPKFGKPYDDEFNLSKPAVKMFNDGSNMVMEAEFISEKFPGMVITQILTLSASGIISRKYLVENRGKKERDVMVRDSLWFPIDDYAVFRYRGQITQNHSAAKPDGVSDGLESVDMDDFEENWIFEDNPSSPIGICWTHKNTPGVKWGASAAFEIDCGNMAPGQSFETSEIQIVNGLFRNYNDFRNYALGLCERDNNVPARRVDVRLNGFNPIADGAALLKDGMTVDIINNRETDMEGSITIKPGQQSSEAFFEEETKVNDDDELVENIDFTAKMRSIPSNCVGFVNIQMNLASYEKTYDRLLFFPKGEVTCSQVGTIYEVSNGCIVFKADPNYGHMCYSLSTESADGKKQEWLLNQHPDHKPLAWWSPFLGGMHIVPTEMNNSAMIKEHASVDFAEAEDSFGNVWKGIRTTLTIKEDDELKGAIYETYFLTLPGLPLLCTFFRFINDTGVYRNDSADMFIYTRPADEVVSSDIRAEFKDKACQEFRLRFGESYAEAEFENIVKISGTRDENMYAFHFNSRKEKYNIIDCDSRHPPLIAFCMKAPAAPGEPFTSSPSFILFSEQNLPDGAVDDFERVEFL